MKDFLTEITNFVGLAWWIEINTDIPRCTYYFGPFISKEEALLYKDGYIEDLQNEQAKGISVSIKRYKPTELTISEESSDNNNLGNFFSLTTQSSF